MRQSLLLSCILVGLTCGCSNPLPTLDGVDLLVWKDDRLGCLGKRAEFEESLRGQRDKLKGLSEMDVVKLLGRPDRNDLSERREKYYFYFLDPAPGCDDGDSTATQLIIRFNSTGVSKEVSIE
jgi:hypothetical protein